MQRSAKNSFGITFHVLYKNKLMGGLHRLLSRRAASSSKHNFLTIYCLFINSHLIMFRAKFMWLWPIYERNQSLRMRYDLL